MISFEDYKAAVREEFVSELESLDKEDRKSYLKGIDNSKDLQELFNVLEDYYEADYNQDTAFDCFTYGVIDSE